jgi:hypothetical protein
MNQQGCLSGETQLDRQVLQKIKNPRQCATLGPAKSSLLLPHGKACQLYPLPSPRDSSPCPSFPPSMTDPLLMARTSSLGKMLPQQEVPTNFS